MPILAPPPSTPDGPICPEGLHPAICVSVDDHGTVETTYGAKHQISLRFQANVGGAPFEVWRRYNLTLHEKGQLRKDLETWRGKAFTDTEIAQGFDLEQLINQRAQVQVQHVTKNDAIYANVVGVTVAAAAPPQAVAMPAENEIPF